MPTFEPGLLSEGTPLLCRLDDVLTQLDWAVPVDALGPGQPRVASPPRRLRTTLLDRRTSYADRDALWAGLIRRCQGRGRPDGRWWRLIAVGLAVPGLLTAAARIRDKLALRPSEVSDLHASLAEGLLVRLDTIDPGGRNLGGRLVYGAAGYATRRCRESREIPAILDVDRAGRALRPQFGQPDVGLARVARAINAANGRNGQLPLDATDVALIARTGLEHQTVNEVAAQLGLGVEAAYKRRRRAELLIAHHVGLDLERSAITADNVP